MKQEALWGHLYVLIKNWTKNTWSTLKFQFKIVWLYSRKPYQELSQSFYNYKILHLLTTKANKPVEIWFEKKNSQEASLRIVSHYIIYLKLFSFYLQKAKTVMNFECGTCVERLLVDILRGLREENIGMDGTRHSNLQLGKYISVSEYLFILCVNLICITKWVNFLFEENEISILSLLSNNYLL